MGKIANWSWLGRRGGTGFAVGLLGVALGGFLLGLAGCTQMEMMLADSEGEALYIQKCRRCHGHDGSGNTPRSMGNPFADLVDDNWSRGGDRIALENSIREGVVGLMPAYPELTKDEMNALIRYIRELRGERKPR